MRLHSKPQLVALASFAVIPLVSAIEIKRQGPEPTDTSSSPEIKLPTSTASLDCFDTVLKPTSTCSASRGTTLNCTPSVATITSCKSDKNCFKNSQQEDVCVPRNDKVAPAGIAFAVAVAVIVTIIAVTLIVQRVKQKRKKRQILDDRVRGVHMGMTGSRKVEVTFVERRAREGDDEFLLHDIPPAYTEADRRRGVPSVSLNGGALPRYDEDEPRRDDRLERR